VRCRRCAVVAGEPEPPLPFQATIAKLGPPCLPPRYLIIAAPLPGATELGRFVAGDTHTSFLPRGEPSTVVVVGIETHEREAILSALTGEEESTGNTARPSGFLAACGGLQRQQWHSFLTPRIMRSAQRATHVLPHGALNRPRHAHDVGAGRAQSAHTTRSTAIRASRALIQHRPQAGSVHTHTKWKMRIKKIH
jgi:hypothetical protein